MRFRCFMTFPLLALASTGVAHAEERALPAGFTTEALLKTGVTRDEDRIVYPSSTPQIISVLGTIDKDGRTALHEHPVPVFVHVLEGEIELRSENGEPQHDGGI